MTRDECSQDGWSIIDYDDDLLDFVDAMNAQLKEHGLFLEMADDVFDGFQPVKVMKKTEKTH